jgi:hypothetical protein
LLLNFIIIKAIVELLLWKNSSTLDGEFFLNNCELIVKGKFKAVGSKDAIGIFHIECWTLFIKVDFITGEIGLQQLLRQVSEAQAEGSKSEWILVGG